MHDQADQLRKLVRATVQVDPALAPGGPIIALGGGQAEVGTTTAACGLARELARLGKQVVLIDANLANPVATIQLIAHETPDLARSKRSGTLQDVLTGKRRAVETLAPTSDDHLRLLPGCPPTVTPPLDHAALDRFAAELAALSLQADVVLLDCGHGMNSWIDRLWQLASEVLLVTAPNPQGLLDSYTAVKLSQHHRLHNKLRLLVNRTLDESEVPPLAKRFDATCQRFLFLTPKAAAWLPAWRATAGLPSSATQAPGDHCWTSQQCHPPDEPLQRALRLLAADLACDLRVSSLRLIQPSHQRQHSMHSPTKEEESLTQRR